MKPNQCTRSTDPSSTSEFARGLFAPIADDYEIWSKALSFGQDPRWRELMISRMDLSPGSHVLDVAAGTGLVTRLLEKQGYRVIAADQSREMLSQAARRGAHVVNGRAEALPFRDEAFDGLTFTYLLRYVDDPVCCMQELARVVRPGGTVGMVEFGRPKGPWGPLWWLYTRVGLPISGTLIAPGWSKVGLFLGGSIDDFHRRFPRSGLKTLWEQAGLEQVEMLHPSLGGGLVMTGRKR
ncbi:MAG: class I SAM-dependent methyltransferase [Desulfovibrionales bacterium]